MVTGMVTGTVTGTESACSGAALPEGWAVWGPASATAGGLATTWELALGLAPRTVALLSTPLQCSSPAEATSNAGQGPKPA